MVVASVVVGVVRVRAASIGQVEHIVHLGGGQRNGRRRDPHIAGGSAFAMRLHQRTGVARVGFQMQHAVGMGIQHSVAFDLLVRRQSNHRAVARRHFDLALHVRQRGVANEVERFDGQVGGRGFRSRFGGGFSLNRHAFSLIFPGTGRAIFLGHVRNHQIGVDMRLNPARVVHAGGVDFKPALRGFVAGPANESRAANVGHGQDGFFGGQPVGNFHNGALGIAVQQQVAFGVHHHATAHLVRPIIVVRNAAQ